MEHNSKKPKRPVELLLFLVVAICTALILLDIYINVQNELQGVVLPFAVWVLV